MVSGIVEVHGIVQATNRTLEARPGGKGATLPVGLAGGFGTGLEFSQGSAAAGWELSQATGWDP